jgi:hypothetical protein
LTRTEKHRSNGDLKTIHNVGFNEPRNRIATALDEKAVKAACV